MGHRRGDAGRPRGGARLTDAQGNPHTHKSASTVVAAPGIAEQLATVIRNTEVPSDRYAAAVG